MDITFNQSLVQRCYDYLNDDIKDLERRKEQALASGTATGYQLAKKIEGQIRKKQEELEHIKYALYNMT